MLTRGRLMAHRIVPRRRTGLALDSDADGVIEPRDALQDSSTVAGQVFGNTKISCGRDRARCGCCKNSLELQTWQKTWEKQMKQHTKTCDCYERTVYRCRCRTLEWYCWPDGKDGLWQTAVDRYVGHGCTKVDNVMCAWALQLAKIAKDHLVPGLVLCGYDVRRASKISVSPSSPSSINCRLIESP